MTIVNEPVQGFSANCLAFGQNLCVWDIILLPHAGYLAKSPKMESGNGQARQHDSGIKSMSLRLSATKYRRENNGFVDYRLIVVQCDALLIPQSMTELAESHTRLGQASTDLFVCVYFP